MKFDGNSIRHHAGTEGLRGRPFDPSIIVDLTLWTVHMVGALKTEFL